MQVLCTDFYGNKHPVDLEELVDRVSAYGVCIISDKVLLIKDPRSLRWELPGGGVEENETEIQGLKREIIEEAGVRPVQVSFLTEWQEYFYDAISEQAWRSHRKCYLVKDIDTANGLLLNGNGEDSGSVEFKAVDAIGSLLMAESIKDTITHARKVLKSRDNISWSFIA